MLDNYLLDQKVAYKIIVNSIKKNRKSHAYLIETNDNPSGLDFALSFAKFLLCPLNKTNNYNCVSCTQCKRIDDGNFLDLYVLKSDGLQIKKEQILLLQEEFNTKSLESSMKIYIIEEAEKLNSSSSAALLKFLEEPEENIIAILVTVNKNLLLNTIVSRCQCISLTNRKEKNDIVNIVYNMNKNTLHCNEESDIQKEEIEKKIDAVKLFLDLLNKKGMEVIADENKFWYNFFNTKEDFILAFDIMIVLLKNQVDNEITNENQNNKLNKIIKILDLAIDYKEKIKYNLNLNLLLDKFIIEVGRI